MPGGRLDHTGTLHWLDGKYLEYLDGNPWGISSMGTSLGQEHCFHKYFLVYITLVIYIFLWGFPQVGGTPKLSVNVGDSPVAMHDIRIPILSSSHIHQDRGFLNWGSPSHHGFICTKSWSSMTWMIWGTPMNQETSISIFMEGIWGNLHEDWMCGVP